MKQIISIQTLYRRILLAAGSLLMAGVILLTLLWFLCTGVIPVVAAPTAELHVCPSGPPTCDYASVQAAVDAANPGDLIKIATGVYTDIHAREGITQVVYISKTITLHGGYTTTDWDTLDPEANPTTLDAGGGGWVLTISGGITLTINGINITGGDDSIFEGGGVNIFQASVVMSDTQIFENIGRGIKVVEGDLTLAASEVSHNIGGGIYLSSSDAVLEGNQIFSNTGAIHGGGIYHWGGSIVLTENIIAGNATIANAGNNGGGAYLIEVDATLIGNTIADNFANQSGGGLKIYESSVNLYGNTVTGNRTVASWNGCGGMSWGRSEGVVRSNIFAMNTSEYICGGIGISHSDNVTLDGNIIVSNTAVDNGGGVYIGYNGNVNMINNVIADNHSDNQGSGLYIYAASPQLRHNTIAHNSGGLGCGIYVTNYGPNNELSHVTLFNNIISSHTTGIYVTGGNSASLDGTLWGNTIDWAGDGTIHLGTVNLYGDPAFVDPAAWDYHLQDVSPAIDAGVDAGVTTDIDGDSRPWGLGNDIGADEYILPRSGCGYPHLRARGSRCADL